MTDGLTEAQREYFRILETLDPSDDMRRIMDAAKDDLRYRARRAGYEQLARHKPRRQILRRLTGTARWRVIDAFIMFLLTFITFGSCLCLVALAGGAINVWSIGASLLVTLFVMARGLGISR